MKTMHTLIQSEKKPNIASFDSSTYQLKEKLNKTKSNLIFQFYQKLFLLFLAAFALLIFPESPKNLEILCEKYHSTEACSVW